LQRVNLDLRINSDVTLITGTLVTIPFVFVLPKLISSVSKFSAMTSKAHFPECRRRKSPGTQGLTL
jgi:hypothetical protein